MTDHECSSDEDCGDLCLWGSDEETITEFEQMVFDSNIPHQNELQPRSLQPPVPKYCDCRDLVGEMNEVNEADRVNADDRLWATVLATFWDEEELDMGVRVACYDSTNTLETLYLCAFDTMLTLC
jgi:hypothetical protein